ncbi:terminase small subunit [Zhongshania sp.]|uniref:terminase small subunit n=1 Tax=Zhongshania sp. TaxID=1971902 RepID=UPI0035662CE9
MPKKTNPAKPKIPQKPYDPSGPLSNARHERFAQEYLIDLVGSAAYKRAGYKATGHAAESNAEKLLRNTEVVARIDHLKAERQERTEIKADSVVREIARHGFADVRRLFTPAGLLKDLQSIDDDTAAAIQSIEVVTRPAGRDADGNTEVEHVHKIKLVDKQSALDKLMRHLSAYNDKAPEHREDDPLVMALKEAAGHVLRPEG